MTNAQIIMETMLSEIADGNLDESILEEEIDTFAGWKRKGYSVKKGEKASFQATIWKPKKSKKENSEEVVDAESTEDKENKYSRMILVKAFFFTENQVEKIERKEVC